jgi:hypothetical protein
VYKLGPVQFGTALSGKICSSIWIRFKKSAVILPFKTQWLLYIPSALTLRNCNESVQQLRRTEIVFGGCSELAGSLCVSVGIDGLGDVLEQLT